MTTPVIEIIFWLSALAFAVCAFRLFFFAHTTSMIGAAAIAASMPLLIGLLYSLFFMTSWFGTLDPRENGLYDGPGIAENLRRIIAPITHGVELTILLFVVQALILFLRKPKG